MNQRPPRIAAVLFILATFAAPATMAQFRTLPQDAKVGRTGETQPLPIVKIDGKLLKLAPGGVIYDENNRTILQGQLPAGVRVAYSFELGGDITRIYILTASELALIDKKK
jgi:hypothetical protein